MLRLRTRSGRGVQHYVIKFASDSTNKTNRHNITDILLKVALEHRQTNKQTNRHTFCRDRDHIVVG
jgi:hypothetical protein